MIFESVGYLVAVELVWIAFAVDSFVMMSDDQGHIGVEINLVENALPDCWVLLHLPALFQCEWAVLL